MKERSKGSQFLSGFGNENILEEYYAGQNQDLTPTAVLSERDEVYKIEIGIPFMGKGDIKVEIAEERLIVTGHRPEPDDAEGGESKNYRGIFLLPQNVQADIIYYTYKDDLLTIVLPKVQVSAQHRQSQRK
jgi:HSP20 family molecular chaperone IbpA